MSDQDTTEAEQEVGALELEIVPVEEAEAEAAAAREAEASVADGEAAQEIAAVEPEMDDDLFVEEGEQEASAPIDDAQPAEPTTEPSSPARERVANDSLGDDVMLFDDDEDFAQVEESPAGDDEDDGFLVIDDTPASTRPSSAPSAAANNGDNKLASAADIEGLTEIVLDAAGAANEAAHSTNQSIHMLLGSVTTINKMAKDLRKTNSYVLAFLSIMGFLGLMSGGVMLYVLQGAVKDATAISVAMATKMVRFERGFETQLGRLSTLENQLIDVADTSHALGMRVEQAVHFMDEAGTQAQQAVSSQATQSQAMLGDVNAQITSSFTQMQKVSEQQQAVLTLLKQRIESLEGQMKKVQNQDLVGKMKALIALEQQRYYELEQAKLEQQQAIFEAQQAAAQEVKPITDTFITFGVQTETSN
jgi:glycerol-3-phosphate responsive antiterminator